MRGADMIVLVIVALLGLGLGYVEKQHGKETIRNEAIRVGVAHRVITDPVTGKTEFRWKTNCVEVE